MLHRALTILAALVLTVACQKPQEQKIVERFTSIEGIKDYKASANAGVAASVKLSATGQWKASANASWVSFSKDWGYAGTFTVDIKVQANESADKRSATVTFSCGEDSQSLYLVQEGASSTPEPGPETGGPYITDPFSTDLVFSRGRLRTTSAVMQSFDVDLPMGMIYYSQLNSKFRAYISVGPVNSTSQPPMMTLNYFGHVSNFTLETAEDGKKYIWIDNFSSKNASGDYWGSPVISRIPFSTGVTMNSWEAPENYYFGEINISGAVDIEGDMLTTLGISSGNCNTYRLSELRALPIEDITLPEVTYGGEDKSSDPLTTKRHVIKGRDCTKVKPIGHFVIPREHYVDGTQVSWQGFDIHDGLIYQAQGNGHDDGTPSPGWLQIRGIDGSTILPLTKITALEDVGALRDAGITDIGYMEPEGVKVRGNHLYLGFASKKADGVRMGTIFRYSKEAFKH
ncbi:MAG: BACON domain-containing protein [Bacteroidales bacterium]|nr:BACON domain-containing protein [Bacteroidales bacterium]